MKLLRSGTQAESMTRFSAFVCRLLLALLLAILAGCTSRLTTGPFAEVKRIEVELHRGSSTAADVRRILGAPRGMGQAALPTDSFSHEVWLYDDIEITDISSIPQQGLGLNMRQQVLLVFFRKGVFDGFMWFTNAVSADER